MLTHWRYCSLALSHGNGLHIETGSRILSQLPETPQFTTDATQAIRRHIYRLLFSLGLHTILCTMPPLDLELPHGQELAGSLIQSTNRNKEQGNDSTRNEVESNIGERIRTQQTSVELPLGSSWNSTKPVRNMPLKKKYWHLVGVSWNSYDRRASWIKINQHSWNVW